MATVVIDPGHGGQAAVGGSSANNATGPAGLLEKAVTLDLAVRVRDLLAARGIAARLTREQDRNLGLRERADVARSNAADAFVSIHCNAFDRSAQGTETFHHRDGSGDCRALAQLVQAAVRKATGLADRGVKDAAFAVLRPDHHAPSTAACLLEVSFMDVATEEARLRTRAYKDGIATALAGAIIGWLVADRRLAQPLAAALDADGEAQDGFEAQRQDAAAVPPVQGQPPVPPAAALREPQRALSGADDVAFLADPNTPAPHGVAGIGDLGQMLAGWRRQRLCLHGASELRPELLIGRDESLEAALLELLARRRRGVAIIRAQGRDYRGRRGQWRGTGFLVAPNLLLSNHHVLNSHEVASFAEVAFDYEIAAAVLASGRRAEPPPGRTYRLMPDRLFITSPLDDGLDYSFVWMEEAPADRDAIIRMERAAFSILPDERAFLIHHPNGAPKRVSLDDADIVGARPDGAVIHYTSDTEVGSSGAPVFDRTGRLIALHHASRANTAQAAASDGSVPQFVNEGIKIAAIALDLEARRAIAPSAAIDQVLGEIHGSDTLTGFFGAAGRSDAAAHGGVDRVEQLYHGTAGDLDIGFWDMAWMGERGPDMVDEVATAMTDLGLDIWGLLAISPEATEALVAAIAGRFGLQLACLHVGRNSASSGEGAGVVWNPATVEAQRIDWPDEIERLFHLGGETAAPGTGARALPPGKLFASCPAAFRFAALDGPGEGLGVNLVPVHIPASDGEGERRRLATDVLARAVRQMIGVHGTDGDWVLGGGLDAQVASDPFADLPAGGFRTLSAQDENMGAVSFLKGPRSPVGRVFLSPNLSRLFGSHDDLVLAKENSQVNCLARLAGHRPMLLRLSAVDGGASHQAGSASSTQAALQRQVDRLLGRTPPGDGTINGEALLDKAQPA